MSLGESTEKVLVNHAKGSVFCVTVNNPMHRAAVCPVVGLSVGLLLRALRKPVNVDTQTEAPTPPGAHPVPKGAPSPSQHTKVQPQPCSDWSAVLVCTLSLLSTHQLASIRLSCKQCYDGSRLLVHHSKEWNRSWRKIVKQREEALSALQEQVLDQLAAVGAAAAPNEQNSEAHKRLNRNLTHGANSGVLIDFSEEDGRAAYTHTKMYSRGRLTSNILLMNHPVLQWVADQLLLRHTVCHAASIGGGPGFDLLSLAFLKEYFGLSCRVRVDVYDIEAAWQHTVDAMGSSLHHCAESSFSTCDIRQLVTAPENQTLAATLDSVNLFLFNFVCVENATAMRELEFPFLRGIFSSARAGSIIILTDSADWLWPDIIELAGRRFLAFVVACQRSTPKHALVLVKQHEANLVDSELVKVAETSATHIVRAEGRRARDASGERCLYVNGGGSEVEERLAECSERSRMVIKRKQQLALRLESGGERFD